VAEPCYFASAGDFYGADVRRRNAVECDLGFFSTHDRRHSVRITWISTTEELIAVRRTDDATGIELLGLIPSEACARAIVWRARQERPYTLEEIRRRVKDLSRDDADLARFLVNTQTRQRAEEERLAAERRASFAITQLEELPHDGVERQETEGAGSRACGCEYCSGSWPAIARASICALRSLLDPLDPSELARFAEIRLKAERDRRWFLSLFSHPIEVIPGTGVFTNGRHRTHALRVAEVSQVVIYTGAGET
jgi:hypothetical protein